MPGPAPKPAGQRRRRNAPTAAATLPATGSGRRPPKLAGSKDMLASTRAWWKTVWASPMAAMWVEADLPALLRLAQLQDLTTRELTGWTHRPLRVGDLELDEETMVVRVTLAGALVSATLLAEMRQLEDRLGLSPMARRRLQWEIADDVAGEAVVDEVAQRRDGRFSRAAVS